MVCEKERDGCVRKFRTHGFELVRDAGVSEQSFQRLFCQKLVMRLERRDRASRFATCVDEMQKR